MQLDRPLCVIDVEGTGLNTQADRIISLAIVKIYPEGVREHFYRLFDPQRPIPPKIAELTGISDADVKGKPLFSMLAAEVRDWLDGCYVAGFNVLNYDLPILAAEMERAGVVFKIDFGRVIDAGNLFKKKEERTLTAALRFYCGRQLDGAHNALEDAQAAADVLRAQLERYDDLRSMTFEDLARFSQFERRIDIAGKLAMDDDGDAVYNFGHNTKGERVRDNVGFAQWMLARDFPAETKERLREILSDIYEASVAESHVDGPRGSWYDEDDYGDEDDGLGGDDDFETTNEDASEEKSLYATEEDEGN